MKDTTPTNDGEARKLVELFDAMPKYTVTDPKVLELEKFDASTSDKVVPQNLSALKQYKPPTAPGN